MVAAHLCDLGNTSLAMQKELRTSLPEAPEVNGITNRQIPLSAVGPFEIPGVVVHFCRDSGSPDPFSEMRSDVGINPRRYRLGDLFAVWTAFERYLGQGELTENQHEEPAHLKIPPIAPAEHEISAQQIREPVGPTDSAERGGLNAKVRPGTPASGPKAYDVVLAFPAGIDDRRNRDSAEKSGPGFQVQLLDSALDDKTTSQDIHDNTLTASVQRPPPAGIAYFQKARAGFER